MVSASLTPSGYIGEDFAAHPETLRLRAEGVVAVHARKPTAQYCDVFGSILLNHERLSFHVFKTILLYFPDIW